MANTKFGSGSTDYFGTFLDTVQKRRKLGAEEARDVPTMVLVALRDGAKPVSDLVQSTGPSVSEITDALERLEKFGWIAFETTPDGSKTVRLTSDGGRAAEKAAHASA